MFLLQAAQCRSIDQSAFPAPGESVRQDFLRSSVVEVFRLKFSPSHGCSVGSLRPGQQDLIFKVQVQDRVEFNI